MTVDQIILPNAPAISGLTFRHFRGESDYPAMAAAIALSADADGVERATTVEDIANNYAHLTNSDPFQDLLIAEVDGRMIGYSRGWWMIEEADGSYLYGFVGFLVPAWRRKGIGTAILHWLEARLRLISAGHPAQRPKFFQAFAEQSETGLIAMLEKEGYQPVRYAFEMVRPTLEDIADFPLPEGLEVRPVLPEHYRLLWEVDADAFRDNWGFVQPSEEDYQNWLGNKAEFQPEIWQVAWDGATNQIVGQVRTFINHAENEKFARKRGYTENISVALPWRKKGVARALISHSLRAQKERGMTESALGVDSENRSGATRVYEDCGFRVVKRSTIYRKAI